MTTPLPALRDFSDRLSPMVVKEMRQGLRTRFFTAALILMHVALMIIMVTLLGHSTTAEATQNFWRALIMVFVVIVPIQGLNALSGEVRSTTLDMLWLTGITPLRVVYGKWLVLFSQTLLMTCTLMPYMIARYRLGGVEMVVELIMLFILVTMSLLASALVVSFSWHPQMWLRLVPSLLALAGCLWMADEISIIATSGNGPLFLDSLSSMHWVEISSLIAASVLPIPGVILFCLIIAASRIETDPSRASSWSKRRLLLALITGHMLLLMILSFTHSASAEWLLRITVGLLLFAGMDLTTEEMPFHQCALRRPGKHDSGVPLGPWFYPGWASGVNAYLSLSVGTIVGTYLVWAVVDLFPRYSWSLSETYIVWKCSLLLEAGLIPACLSRYIGMSYAAWWCTTLALHAIGLMLYLTAQALSLPEITLIGFLSPATALYAAESFPYSVDWLCGISLLWGALWVTGALVMAKMKSRHYSALKSPAQNSSMLPATA